MGAIPHESMSCYIVYLKHKNDMYACPCSTPEASYRLLVFELKFRTHNLFDRLFKRAINMHNR